MENDAILREVAELASHEAKRTFEFADKLQYFYYLEKEKSPQPAGTYSINSVLFEYLGKDQYMKLCKNLQGTKPWFKPEFMNNPVRTEDILFDCQVRNHYTLGQLMSAVKSVL